MTAATATHDQIRTVPRTLRSDLDSGQPLPGLPEIIGHLMAGLDTYDSVIEMTATAQTFGVKQTSVDEFLLGILGQV